MRISKTVVANILFDHDPAHKVTYWGIVSSPMAPISYHAFAQLDSCLVQREWQHCLRYVFSDRSEAISSHHFLMTANLHIDVPKTEPREFKSSRDTAACHKYETALNVADQFTHYLHQLDNSNMIESGNVESIEASFIDAFHHASASILPTRKFHARKPLISQRIYDRSSSARALGPSATSLQK